MKPPKFLIELAACHTVFDIIYADIRPRTSRETAAVGFTSKPAAKERRSATSNRLHQVRRRCPEIHARARKIYRGMRARPQTDSPAQDARVADQWLRVLPRHAL